jgi:RHS repeat-associated protein
MNLVDRFNRERSLTAISRTLRFGRIVANTSVPTTTYSYDANGNLIQAGGWSYVWDYLNRMLASGFNNSTTTYAYDPSGARVLQTSTTSTTYYPNKYYSFASTKIGANTYATSTNYIWNGDTLLATIDQPLYNGSATGSPITRYLHPDHLGSTNAVTDQNGGLVQLMDYYPYGATRIATSTYPTNEKRQYVGQFSDAQTNLNYLNARFYDSSRGQFTSEDPVFWGNPKDQDLQNPQSLNSYSYANDNPITNKDPSGNVSIAALYAVVILLAIAVAALSSGSTSGGGGGESNSIASNALKAADQILTSAGHATVNGTKAITGMAVGTAMTILTPLASPAITGVATPIIGGTAASTPYAITPVSTPQTTGVNLSESGKSDGLSKRKDVPPGTRGIDSLKSKPGVSHDDIERIKETIGQERNDWTGVTPGGDIIINDGYGNAENIGPYENFLH